jgi:hypothetical protein
MICDDLFRILQAPSLGERSMRARVEAPLSADRKAAAVMCVLARRMRLREHAHHQSRAGDSGAHQRVGTMQGAGLSPILLLSRCFSPRCTALQRQFFQVTLEAGAKLDTVGLDLILSPLCAARLFGFKLTNGALWWL